MGRLTSKHDGPEEVADRSRRTPLEISPRTVVVASLLGAATLGLLGSLSDISLGDECVHVRHVRAYIESHYRVLYDPAFDRFFRDPTLNPMPFYGTPLWHVGLAVLWGAAGRESQTLAQVYHAGFYALFALSVYFGARRLWGTAAASWAWLLAATLPMVCAYGILLYQDVPGLAVAMLGLLLLWRRNFLWAGIVLAAAYLTKMNELSFALWAAPFAAWWSGGPWKRRIACAALVAVPVAAALGCDALWRIHSYGSFLAGFPMERRLAAYALSAHAREALLSLPAHAATWRPYVVTDPLALVSQLGLPALLVSAVALARAWDALSRWLWLCAGLTAGVFAGVFIPAGTLQIRYLFPAVVVVLLLGAKVAAGWRMRPWLKVALAAVCVLQAAAASGYVYHTRHISPSDRAAYAWLRVHVPPDGRIMFPEQVLVNETGRTYLWEELNPAYFMAEADDAAREEILRTLGATHIAVPLRRLYDRRKEGDHAGGYARDFVESLETKPYLSKVYANPEFLVFEMTPPPKPPRGGPPTPADPATAPPASGPADTPGR